MNQGTCQLGPKDPALAPPTRAKGPSVGTQPPARAEGPSAGIPWWCGRAPKFRRTRQCEATRYRTAHDARAAQNRKIPPPPPTRPTAVSRRHITVPKMENTPRPLPLAVASRSPQIQVDPHELPPPPPATQMVHCTAGLQRNWSRTKLVYSWLEQNWIGGGGGLGVAAGEAAYHVQQVPCKS